jgi:hypothetical protein
MARFLCEWTGSGEKHVPASDNAITGPVCPQTGRGLLDSAKGDLDAVRKVVNIDIEPDRYRYRRMETLKMDGDDVIYALVSLKAHRTGPPGTMRRFLLFDCGRRHNFRPWKASDWVGDKLSGEKTVPAPDRMGLGDESVGRKTFSITTDFGVRAMR